MKADTAGLFSRMKDNPVMLALIAMLLISVGVMAYIAYVLFQDSKRDQGYLQLVADLRASSFQLTSLSRDATAGDEQAFESLSQVVKAMSETSRALQSGDNQTRLLLSSELSAYEAAWNSTRKNATVITENKDTILFLHNVATTLNEAIPQLQSEHDLIVEILLENNAPADQVAVAQMQSWRAERIARNVDKMLRGGGDANRAADQFNLDANLFGKVLAGMESGDVAMDISPITDPEAKESLTEVAELFGFVSGQVRDIFEASPALFQARQAANGILDESANLLGALTALSDRIASLPTERKLNTAVLGIMAAIALLCLLSIGLLLNGATKRRLKETADTNDRNQNAILRLLDELADLADGDLTTTATVTEDFTGAIADSINYTIDQLRILVSRINDTSGRVVGSSSDTQQTALHLAEAAEHQAQEIAGASAAINEMAVTIDQVSANAAESAGVAERSVSIAKNGAKVVQNTIHGMDTIREQIQDTSKRIKRLGESSQEIGDIVGLINDIADQTNILALNAAIQASMAGDAGRGFAVVADEVQRLAERSATATKQIESLVKTIQNDTNEAVISMEQTTSEVVRGARLAQDAGVALEEIETVSANLAELIQNISNAARQQASSAGHISNTMNVIQEITSQTSAGTNATAKSIGNLSELATELSESVSGFKLPDEVEAEEELSDEADYEADTELNEVEALDDEVMELTDEEMLTEFEEAYAEEIGEESDDQVRV
ncbi:methyl-accepting chemotaxis protein [Agaribacterium haliotis]|uniref:methyl-accepting chemotaxis protein n=1 Tax=Agaribacterium haliotis TaxID=2013869 RepID=UPI000BB58B48|nr:methyl-accepting chemotaxis protein [Agaribacterium haliotis]